MRTKTDQIHSDHGGRWPRVKLKYVARFAYGDSLSSTANVPGAVPVFGSNGPYATTTSPNTLSPVIVVGRKGSYGKINWSPQSVFASDTTFFIDHLATEHDLRWLFWLLQTLGLDTTSDDAAVPGLNRENAYSMSVFLPPLPTQRAIADYLDTETARIDALIAAKENLLTLLAEKRKALITEAVTRGLDPSVPMRDSGIPWLGEIPAHWGVTRLKFLLEGIEQGWSPQCDSFPAGPNEWGVMKTGCVNGATFDETENKRLPDNLEPRTEYELHSGDFLISRANTTSLVGSAALVRNVRRQLLLCDKLYRLRVDHRRLNTQFLEMFFNTPVGRYEFERDASGASGSMQNISQDSVRNLWLAVPPQDTQVQIVRATQLRLKQADAVVAATQETIELLHERREALIAAAVTGQLEVGV